MLSLIKTGRKSMLVVKEFIILIFLLVLVSLPLLLKLFNYFISMPKAKLLITFFILGIAMFMLFRSHQIYVFVREAIK